MALAATMALVNAMGVVAVAEDSFFWYKMGVWYAWNRFQWLLTSHPMQNVSSSPELVGRRVQSRVAYFERFHERQNWCFPMTDDGAVSDLRSHLEMGSRTCCVTCVSTSGRVEESRRLRTILETSVTLMLASCKTLIAFSIARGNRTYTLLRVDTPPLSRGWEVQWSKFQRVTYTFEHTGGYWAWVSNNWRMKFWIIAHKRTICL